MIKKIGGAFSLWLLFNICILKAAPGDTTHVRFHQKTDMTWYGNYDVKGLFPAQGKTWNRILLKYTMGCASGGCSGWDYTTHIQLLEPTGKMDSTIKKIDTTQTGIDTTWNVFEVNERWELARVITPYGTYMRNNSNGYNNQWTHEHWFDITDFAPLLHDSMVLRAFYSGWSSGFSATTDFYFIEGTPTRPVVKLYNLWGKGGNGYGFKDSASFNASVFPEFSFKPSPSTTSVKIMHTPTGHGFDNSMYAAEFYPEPFHLMLNGQSVKRWIMWNDQCGENPIQPQGGTWIFDRANWCPGLPAGIFSQEIGHLLNKQDSTKIAYRYEDYSWSGTQTPSYSISSILVEYGASTITGDVRLDDIISPNNDANFSGQNPNCMYPIIRFTNMGKDTLRTLDIEYGVQGNAPQTQSWKGVLAPFSSEIFTLMRPNWEQSASVQKFTVKLLMPGDPTLFDNSKTVSFVPPPVHEPKMVVWFKTNKRFNENRYSFIDESGKVIFTKTFSAPLTIYKDTVHLPQGCIQFRVEDKGGDGIDWWANRDSAGIGYLHFRNMKGVVSKRFDPDFGEAIEYQFSSGFALNAEVVNSTPTPLIYPNPFKNQIHISLSQHPTAQLRIFNIQGQLLQDFQIQSEQDLSLESLPCGMYFFVIQEGEHLSTTKVLCQER